MRTFTSILAASAILAGIAGPAAAQSFGVGSFFAVVNGANGGVLISSGVQSSSKTGTGKYAVVFSRPLNSCAYVATPAGGNGGQASLALQSGQPTRINVSTFSKTGAAANLSFRLIVFCAP